MDLQGFDLKELSDVYREEFLHAVEFARARCDPAVDWDGFVEELWRLLVPAFGLDVTVTEAGPAEE